MTKKISDFLEKPGEDNRQVVKAPAVVGEIIDIEEAHFRKGDNEKQYVSVYFTFAEDVERIPYVWNTSSGVIMDQVRKLKDAKAFDGEPIRALVGKRQTKAGLWYYTLLDPEDTAVPGEGGL